MMLALGLSLLTTASGGGGGTPSAPVNVTPASIDIGDGLIGTVAVATPGTWNDADTVTGQWQTFNSLDWIDLSGETGVDYTLSTDDPASDIRYVETATNVHGDTVQPSNVATTQPPADPSNVTPPVIVLSGGTLAELTSPGEWNGNSPPGGYTYQWQQYYEGAWQDMVGEVGDSTLFISGVSNPVHCVVTTYNEYYRNPHQGTAESNTLS
jgi:hypothetical protein